MIASPLPAFPLPVCRGPVLVAVDRLHSTYDLSQHIVDLTVISPVKFILNYVNANALFFLDKYH